MSTFVDLCQSTTDIILKSHKILSAETDRSPRNQKVTDTLTQLVRTLSGCQCDRVTEHLLKTPILAAARHELPRLCAEAECEMEKFWAKKLLSQTFCELHQFWYMPEYQELCMAEMQLLNGKNYNRISFLGSGALPLTAIILAKYMKNAQIVCVDYDAEACDLSSQLISRTGMDARIEVLKMDAARYVPDENELVICASLLEGKEQVYKNIQNRKNGSMIVRDAEGIYQFLYNPAILPRENFVEISKTYLDSKRINTSRYYHVQSLVRNAA